MMPLFVLAVAASGAAGSGPCPGTTTIEVNACLAGHLRDADASLNRYYQAALQRLRKENGDKVAQHLVRAERSWIGYRDEECGAVSDFWGGGTIRASMELDCQIRLTRIRTYTVWRDWLPYPDSTPPLLPRPDVEGAPSDRRR